MLGSGSESPVLVQVAFIIWEYIITTKIKNKERMQAIRILPYGRTIEKEYQYEEQKKIQNHKIGVP